MRNRKLSIISLIGISLTGMGLYMDADAPNESLLMTCMELVLMTIVVFGVLVLLYEGTVLIISLLRRGIGLRKPGY